MNDDFLYRDVPALGRRVFRLGLATNYGVEGTDLEWAWSLKCVRKPRENSKSTFDIRIFSSTTVANHGVKVSDYTSLDNYMDLVIFAGWYDKNTQSVQLERLIKKAV
jgi:hypothetical protein